MTVTENSDMSDIRETIANALAAHRKFFLWEGLALMVLGGLAFAYPLISTLAIEIFIGWLFIVGGVSRVVSRIRARHLPGYWWSLASGILAIALGGVLVAMPLQGALTLTLVLMFIFLIEGISAIIAALDFRHHSSSWGWVLFSGIINLVLISIIWSGLPGISVWAIGLFVGIDLIFGGLSLVMLSIAAHQKPLDRVPSNRRTS